MPWHIGRSDKCPASKPYAVIKNSDNSVAGCHALRFDAKQQLAALYANVKGTTMEPLKAEQLTSAKFRVLAIPFGGPFKGNKDIQHEYFSPRTDIKADWFPERPVLFHHGKDELLGDDGIGIEEELELEKDGWWGKVWLDRSNRYWEKVRTLLAAGKMYGSSGPIAHLVKTARDGEILTWPHAEQTLTPVPANFFSRVIPAKAMLEHFSSAGIEVETLKSLLPDDPSDDLGADLPSGGDDLARRRVFVHANAELARLKTL